jgi:C1A family cysteine protease
VPQVNIKELRKAISESGASWETVEEVKKQYRLGYEPSDKRLDIREIGAKANLAYFLATEWTPKRYPTDFDWRNVSGKNYVTPIRDQGDCGSCVSFGCIASVESALCIQKNQPDADINLSEAHLFFCQSAPAVTCKTGWYPEAALNSLRTNGVVDERCYPYTDHDQACTLCADWQNRLTYIRLWMPLKSHSEMKEWISNRGPVIACFSVFDDFFAYRRGVYHHVYGKDRIGGHCVCCVGYDDSSRHWVCKNSWGQDWGEQGFFRIRYGEVGIDTQMWGVSL